MRRMIVILGLSCLIVSGCATKTGTGAVVGGVVGAAAGGAIGGPKGAMIGTAAEFEFEFIDVLVIEWLHLEQAVDEQPVALYRRDTPRRGVRRLHQPQFLQVGHDIADGGRTQPQGQLSGKRTRAYWLAITDVAFHQTLEQGLRAFIEYRFCHVLLTSENKLCLPSSI